MANTKITSRVIADDAVTTAAIADDAVTTATIADDVALGGNPTTTTQSAGNSTTRIATTAFVTTAVSNLVDSAPGALDTLNELAAALGDDASFSTTVTNSIATKLAASGANQTLADSGNLTIDVAGNILLDSDAANWQFNDDGTPLGTIHGSSSDMYISVATQDKDLIFRGDDGGSTINALSLDMSEAGAASFNGVVTANAGVVVDNITIDGTEIDLSSGDLTIDVAGDINLDADGGDINFKDGGTTYGFASKYNNDLWLGNSISDGDVTIRGSDGGSSISALTFDMSAAGAATFNDKVIADSFESTAGGTFTTASGNDLNIVYPDSRSLFIKEGSTTHVAVDNAGNVGIKTASPGSFNAAGNDFVVGAGTSGDNNGMTIYTNSDSTGHLLFADGTSGTDAYTGYIGYTHSSNYMSFHTGGGGLRLAVDSAGRVIIGGPSQHANGYSTPGGNSGENSHYAKLWIQGNTASTAGDGRLVLASGTSWPSSGTQIGSIWFSTAWGGDHASIRAVTNGGTGNSDYPASLHFDTTADGASSPTERFVVRMDGGLQIPASSSNAGASLAGYIAHHTNNYFYMRGGTEGLYLMSGNAEASQGRIFVPGGGNAMTFVINNSTRLSIAADGTFTGSASNDISDQRLKKNIKTIPNALEKIKGLTGRTFQWKENAGQAPGTKYGFIAQEVESSLSDLVHSDSGIMKIQSNGSLNKNPSDEDDGEYAKSVQSTGVIPILVEAIKELSAELESAKERIASLEA